MSRSDYSKLLTRFGADFQAAAIRGISRPDLNENLQTLRNQWTASSDHNPVILQAKEDLHKDNHLCASTPLILDIQKTRNII